MPRCALYARISEDRLGLELGVDRQLDQLRQLAAGRGWDVEREYVDNDLSAYAGRARPAYSELLADARAGRFQHLLAWDLTRLWRTGRERVAAIEQLREDRVGVAFAKGSDLDFTTAGGRLVAGLLGEVAEHESGLKSERVAAAAEERARRGQANGALAWGWRRAYERNGHGDVVSWRDEVDPERAAVVEAVVDALLAGHSLRQVTEALNGDEAVGAALGPGYPALAHAVPAPGASFTFKTKQRGRDNPDGVRWSKSSVKKLATRPGNIGLRVYHRGRPDEQLLPAAWAPLYDGRSKHDRVVALLNDPARRTTRDGARRHLLTGGIAECGRCGAALNVRVRGHKDYGRKQLTYLCERSEHLGRNEAAVDAWVGEVVIARLERDDAAHLLVGDDAALHEGERHAQGLRDRLGGVRRAVAAGRLGVDDLIAVRAELDPLIEAAERRVELLRRESAVDLTTMVGGRARACWESLDVVRRRAVLRALQLRVVIHPVRRRGPGFDPDAVEIVWPGHGAAE